MKYAAAITADALSVYFNSDGPIDGAALQRLHEDVKIKSDEGEYRILVFDANFTVISGTNVRTEWSQVGKTLLIPEVVSAMTNKNDAYIRRGEGAVYSAAAIDDSTGSQKLGALLLVASAEDIFEAMEDIKRRILYTILTAGFVIFVVVIFMSQALLVPLRRILRVVVKMSDGHLSQRISLRGRDEYSRLASAFNEMTQKLEQVDQTREEFVFNVSHELKTPLSSMKVLSESLLIRETVPDETYREFLQDINSEIDRMTNIVGDLLSLVKIDQKEQGLNVRHVDLNRLSEDILKRLSPLAEQKNVELLLEELRSVVIEADEMKLDLAISNIVENGIKYTPAGGSVRITLDADHQHALVTVTDTGIGIPEEEQGKIYNRFYRVDKTRDRETGGTGLGLSISHQTVLLHNGSIRLTSKPGEGSAFLIRLPIIK
ncbi:MAG: cell wall metabolism sensor histidine kinase WalK [Defluviitaleaceae bacterium]|nr:cell wall metabolism sensor histidine kinase WalK [Defluviitaleaceae bacterium]